MDAKALRSNPADTLELVDPRVVSLTDPSGAAAEQFRMLHLRLDRARENRPISVVALTSAVSGEGKSITAANLAACAARRGRRAALVDCDFRRPAVARLFGVDSSDGLSSLLAGKTKLAQSLRKGPFGLDILPAGENPEDPGSLFAGRSFTALLEELRGGHEEIYLDLPPILPFADALVAAGTADGVVVVVRNGGTPAEQVGEAVNALAGLPLLGCVLTACGEGAAAYRKYYARK
ncbi:CpsD/CapB family tyrosine-protein kinase [Vulgatibacter incomptus]|uniref:Tyrosine-protein kinase EpsD n=1 Tax=Vulgatibacter incomptus TaxID=1391653 RepID=A0A0K1PB56_9BACT|nr:CpsD/CapB family tyrosine-protein kinase [Vulgatibacter incomptus]AKU90656.1 Tyrosine-protein kinase EpsD [Vulgatibacter incomptus]